VDLGRFWRQSGLVRFHISAEMGHGKKHQMIWIILVDFCYRTTTLPGSLSFGSSHKHPRRRRMPEDKKRMYYAVSMSLQMYPTE
jgi:hypothetical protein